MLGVVLLLFWNSVFLWPVKIVVVLFHELGHAVAAWVTGGSVTEIGLDPRVGGHTLTRGGWRFVILSSGYLGSLIAGVLLLVATRKAKVARGVSGALAVLCLVVGLLFVRPFLSFGFAFSMAAAVAFVVLARYASAHLNRLVLRALGVFSVMYALFDIRADVFNGAGMSDAHMLAEITMVPAAVWGVIWIAAGIAVLWVMRRRLA